MAFNINDFKSRGLTGGGARPSLFQVTLTTPFAVDSTVTDKFTFTCRAASIPASVVGSIRVPYFGRNINLAGDRVFGEWNVTVMNDEDFSVRNMFENWSNQINQLAGNLKLLPGNSYKTTDAVVSQFSKDGSVIKEYQFVGIFPTSVDAMGVDWSSTDQIQTFGVTFQYDYWLPIQQNGSSNIDTGAPGNVSFIAP